MRGASLCIIVCFSLAAAYAYTLDDLQGTWSYTWHQNGILNLNTTDFSSSFTCFAQDVSFNGVAYVDGVTVTECNDAFSVTVGDQILSNGENCFAYNITSIDDLSFHVYDQWGEDDCYLTTSRTATSFLRTLFDSSSEDDGTVCADVQDAGTTACSIDGEGSLRIWSSWTKISSDLVPVYSDAVASGSSDWLDKLQGKWDRVVYASDNYGGDDDHLICSDIYSEYYRTDILGRNILINSFGYNFTYENYTFTAAPAIFGRAIHSIEGNQVQISYDWTGYDIGCSVFQENADGSLTETRMLINDLTHSPCPSDSDLGQIVCTEEKIVYYAIWTRAPSDESSSSESCPPSSCSLGLSQSLVNTWQQDGQTFSQFSVTATNRGDTASALSFSFDLDATQHVTQFWSITQISDGSTFSLPPWLASGLQPGQSFQFGYIAVTSSPLAIVLSAPTECATHCLDSSSTASSSSGERSCDFAVSQTLGNTWSDGVNTFSQFTATISSANSETITSMTLSTQQAGLITDLWNLDARGSGVYATPSWASAVSQTSTFSFGYIIKSATEATFTQVDIQC